MSDVTLCKGCLIAGAIFAFIGVLWLLGKLKKFLRIPLYSLRNPQKALQAHKSPDASSWAVVTGGSMGMGRAEAEELAKAGYNLVLIARSGDLLNAAKNELEDKYHVRVQVEEADFAAYTASDYSALATKIADLGDIAILVNNAGVTVNPPDLFADVSFELVQRIVSVNCAAMTYLTHELMPALLRHEETTKRRALVICMSSFVSRVPTPMLQVYSATKKYTQHLCEALSYEYAGRINFISAAPWWVATKMTGIRRANWRVLSAEGFARGVFKYAGGTHLEVDPYWLFGAMDLVVESVPASWLAGPITGFMKKVRAAYFRHLKKVQERANEGKKSK